MRIILLLLLWCASTAYACTSRDAWTGPDKAKHAVAGAAIGAAGTLVFKDAHKGFALGAGAGVLKELYDRKHGGTCSLQDAVVTIAGAAAGAYGTGWMIAKKGDAVFVAYSRRF